MKQQQTQQGKDTTRRQATGAGRQRGDDSQFPLQKHNTERNLSTRSHTQRGFTAEKSPHEKKLPTESHHKRSQRITTQHTTQDDVLQVVYPTHRPNAAGAIDLSIQISLETISIASWCQEANPAYNTPCLSHTKLTQTTQEGLEPEPRCHGKQNCVSH